MVVEFLADGSPAEVGLGVAGLEADDGGEVVVGEGEVAPLLPDGGPVEEGEQVGLVFIKHRRVVLLCGWEVGGGLVGKGAVDVGLEEGGVLGE